MLRAAALLLLFCATSAEASEGHGPPKGAERVVDVSAIGAPILWKGRVVNYVFVTSRLNIAPGGDATKLKAQEPFFRDALVRAAHRTPFGDPRDLTRVDEGALAAALMREASRIAGPRAFTSAVVVTQQPRQRTGLPSATTPAPAGRALTP